MSSWNQTLPPASEHIPTTVKNASTMVGKDRTILNSFTENRSVGSFEFFVDDGFPDLNVLVLPLTSADGQPYLDAIEQAKINQYTAQRQYHLEIDPILYTGIAPTFDAGDYGAVNHPLSLDFKNNQLLPPNKNVYFRVEGVGNPNFAFGFPYFNFQTANLPQPSIGFVMYNNTIPVFNGVRNKYENLRKVIEPTGSTGTYDIIWESIFVRRTDANGNIPDMTDTFLAPSFPFDTKDYFQRVSNSNWQQYYDKFEVREIKDRYDCGEGDFRFIPRRYPFLTDNEWDL